MIWFEGGLTSLAGPMPPQPGTGEAHMSEKPSLDDLTTDAYDELNAELIRLTGRGLRPRPAVLGGGDVSTLYGMGAELVLRVCPAGESMNAADVGEEQTRRPRAFAGLPLVRSAGTDGRLGWVLCERLDPLGDLEFEYLQCSLLGNRFAGGREILRVSAVYERFRRAAASRKTEWHKAIYGRLRAMLRSMAGWDVVDGHAANILCRTTTGEYVFCDFGGIEQADSGFDWAR